MNSFASNTLFPLFFRRDRSAAKPPAERNGDVLEELPDREQLLTLSDKLRKKERDLEALRLELAEWERLLSAREDYLRTSEKNLSRPGRPSLEQREAALVRRLREVKEREKVIDRQMALLNLCSRARRAG